MRSSTWRLEDLRNVILNLGFVGENLHTRQIFDCKKVFDQYPNASVSMTVTPPQGEPYPGTIERDGDLVIWDVRDSDLVAEGDGEIQIVFTQSPHIARSYNARTHVCRSQVPTGNVPSGLDDYITRADQLLDQVEDTFPAGGTTGQVLAKKSNADYDTEWVDQGGGTEDYEELENLPQIGGVTLKGNKSLHDLGAATEAAVSEKYTKPSGGIPASDLASGVIPDPTSIIDDTAGDGDTDKVWSADKSVAEAQSLMTEINSKQDAPSATGTAGQVLGLNDSLEPEWKTVSGGGTVDGSLSTSSENPVQNKIITKEINDIEDKRVPVYEEVAGKYINQSGSESSSNAFARSKPIQVEKGELIVLKATGYDTNVSMITKTNEEGTSFQARVYSIDSTERTYSYFVEENGYIIISYKVSGGASHTVTIYGKNASSNMVYRIDGLESLPIKDVISAENLKMVYDNVSMTIGTQGKYILANGNISTSANFNMSTGIQVPAGGTIRFTTRGYNNEVAVLAKVNGDNTYSPLVISIDSTIREYYYSTTEAITVVISTNKNMTPVYSVSTSRIIENEKRISDLEDDVVAFSTMGIIGDSLASGASNYTGGVSDRPLFSWGKFIEREHGIAVSLFSKGGFTTRTWQTHSAGLTALQSANALDCYVLALGVNDAYDLGSAYLGTISDVHVGDESLNADTFYGNYSKIISEIKAKSTRAKIFCITIATETNQTRIDYNVAIKAVANLYTNVYLIDLASDDFYSSARFTETWVSAHSTAVGYKMIAKNIYDHIRDVVRSNLSDFLDIQWIVEDHP